MWRWSHHRIFHVPHWSVFSTYVEVIPLQMYPLCNALGILHVCGGDPMFNGQGNNAIQYSPRMWRWSYQYETSWSVKSVFSTYVEVILPLRYRVHSGYGILHVCGGDPLDPDQGADYSKYSPRMWRWSLHSLVEPSNSLVFSTYVEVILSCLWEIAWV